MGVGPSDFGNRGSPVVTLGDWRRQPDMSWGAPGPGCGHPLSVILEIGISMPWTREYLERDVRAWIESPGSLVNLVITMFIDLSREPWTMTIEKWEPYPPRTDDDNDANKEKKEATPTATRTCVLVIETQNKTVEGSTIDSESRNVISPCDELRIPFETIYRRAPVGRETDIVLDKDALLTLVNAQWRSVRND